MTPSSTPRKRARLAGLVGLALLLLLPLGTGCPFKAETFHRDCTTVADCNDGNPCTADLCTAGICSNPPEAPETPCPDPKGVCDGKGTCVECLVRSGANEYADCAGNYPNDPICDGATDKCVSCNDGVKDGKETGVDCGGPDCGACPAQPCDAKGCGDKTFCDTAEITQLPDGGTTLGICCNTVCNQTCQACTMKNGTAPDGTCSEVPLGKDPFNQCSMTGTATAGGCGAVMLKCACEDGIKNENETDVDCGGGACPGCGGGQTCVQDTDCASNVAHCVKGGCCTAPCLGSCQFCDGTGQCVAAVGQNDPSCTNGLVCGPFGFGCVAKAGALCSANDTCLSDTCTGGMCAKSTSGQACNTSSDGASGNCQNFVCM
jgi:hypothetical protein